MYQLDDIILFINCRVLPENKMIQYELEYFKYGQNKTKNWNNSGTKKGLNPNFKCENCFFFQETHSNNENNILFLKNLLYIEFKPHVVSITGVFKRDVDNLQPH